jgi:hypothetical protein
MSVDEPVAQPTVSPTSTSDEPVAQPTVSPTSVSDKPETESAAVEVPISTLPATNPLAKLMLTMLPNVTPFVPNSNGTNNRPVSPAPIPISIMNNDAPAFVPSQHQHGGGQQHVNNTNTGQWNGPGARGGGAGNRRGQSSGYHHGGGGNQRPGGQFKDINFLL